MSTVDALNDPIDTAVRALQAHSAERLDLTGGRAFAMEDEDVDELMGQDSGLWKNNNTVTALDFSINHLTDEGAKKIAAAINAHGGVLSSLEIDRNKIGDEGAIALIKSLPATMKRLDLSGNDGITDATVKAFVEHMEATDGSCKCTGLHTLILRDCPQLTDAAMDALSWWLAEQQPSLQSLTVSGNEFTDASIPAIKIALQSNATITDLNISNTKIIDFSPLAEAFDSNETLLALTMGSNGKRVNVPKIDGALKFNKRKAIERRNEVALLKEQHAKELKAVKDSHVREVQQLKETIENLRAQLNGDDTTEQ